MIFTGLGAVAELERSLIAEQLLVWRGTALRKIESLEPRINLLELAPSGRRGLLH